ncbi:hypothetical protein MAR_036864 [Mya arenaria]|uniref:Uncharacterized protein n=1 Tax=Mya arenaria TaxID=6604 RepID=A0ABY7FLX6_MYAAR|nr:hypothetical protein MAR_036864 [Mya arenaria]
MVADIRKLLSNLPKSPGILEESVWTDIHSVELYKENKKCWSPTNLNLTATLNTDGVSLYSSSKIELWPFFWQ